MLFKTVGLTSAFALCAAVPSLGEPVFPVSPRSRRPRTCGGRGHRAHHQCRDHIGIRGRDTLVYTTARGRFWGWWISPTRNLRSRWATIDVVRERADDSGVRGRMIFAGVNTSESVCGTFGKVVTVDPARSVVGGMRYRRAAGSVGEGPGWVVLAIAVEMSATEEVNDGAIPQMPAGYWVKLPIK